MAELAEAGNDRTVAAQAGASLAEAKRIAALATELAAIARAAEIVASYAQGPNS